MASEAFLHWFIAAAIFLACSLGRLGRSSAGVKLVGVVAVLAALFYLIRWILWSAEMYSCETRYQRRMHPDNTIESVALFAAVLESCSLGFTLLFDETVWKHACVFVGCAHAIGYCVVPLIIDKYIHPSEVAFSLALPFPLICSMSPSYSPPREGNGQV